VYYGDEIGLYGAGDPDNRRTMPWDETEWDTDLREWYKRIMNLRRTSPALRRGGFQLLVAEGGLVVFQRQSVEQRLIVAGYRGPDDLSEVSVPVWHGGIPDNATLTEMLGSDLILTVKNGSIILRGLVKGAAFVFAVE
jgi:glycosidase